MGYVRMSDLVEAGLAGLPEPNAAGKASLSAVSRSLAAQARSTPLPGLGVVLSQAQSILSQVLQMPTWDENQSWNCGFPLADPCWDNKTTVRQNLQIAVDTARSRLAQSSGQPAPSAPLANQAPVQSVNLARETAANLPAAVQERAVEISQGRIDTPEQRQALGIPAAPPPAPRPAPPSPPPVQRPVPSPPQPPPPPTRQMSIAEMFRSIGPPAPPPPPPRTPAAPTDIQFNFTGSAPVAAPQINTLDFSGVGTSLQASGAASAQRMAEASAASLERSARGPLQIAAQPIARSRAQGLSPVVIALIAGGGIIVVGGVAMLLMSGSSAPQPPPPAQPWVPPPGWVPVQPPAPTANRGRRGRSRP